MKDVVQAVAIALTIAILCECALMVARAIHADEADKRKRDR